MTTDLQITTQGGATVTVPPPDLLIKVEPQAPLVAGEKDDFFVAPIPADLVIMLATDDMVVTPRAQDMVVAALVPDLAIKMTDIGPPGPPGSGAGADFIVTRIATQVLSGHRVVYADSPGHVDYASSDNVATAGKIVGITTGATVALGNAFVQIGDEMEEGSWAWVEGPIYCGINGVLTQTPPASGFVRQIAIATGPTTIIIEFGPVIILA